MRLIIILAVLACAACSPSDPRDTQKAIMRTATPERMEGLVSKPEYTYLILQTGSAKAFLDAADAAQAAGKKEEAAKDEALASTTLEAVKRYLSKSGVTLL